MREWVAQTTGADIADIDPAKPLQTFGLSSRDAVIMSGELENLLGTRIDPTIAYQYPTIASLAAALTAQKTPDAPQYQAARNRADHSPGTRDIAIVGTAGRFPGADSVSEFWQLLIDGQVTTGPLPEGRWSEYLADPLMRTKLEDESTAGGYLSDIASFDNEMFGLSPVSYTHLTLPTKRIV